MGKVGISWFIDLQGVGDPSYHHAETLHHILQQAAEIGNLTILQVGDHQFEKQLQQPDQQGGCTVFLLLSESHLSAHTWPERDQVIIDLFSCGPEHDARRIIEFLVESIPHQQYSINSYGRGS